MPSAGFESATPATKRPQTYALDRAATEVGYIVVRHALFRQVILVFNEFKQAAHISRSYKGIKSILPNLKPLLHGIFHDRCSL
jgi:hypothetical protein